MQNSIAAGDHVGQTKQFRKDLDEVLQRLKKSSQKPTPDHPGRSSRERSTAITKIQEAIMWLGMDLKEMNDGVSCHPEGYNPASPVIHPVADGIKL